MALGKGAFLSRAWRALREMKALVSSIMAEDAAPEASSRFRDHSANERTFLAWVRTGIALITFGFAIARFGLFLREVAQAGQTHVYLGRGLGSAWFGVALVVLGLVTNAAALSRYVGIRRALERGRSIAPSPALVYGLGVGSVVIAVAMAIMLAAAMRD
jgi:putative membrane protein